MIKPVRLRCEYRENPLGIDAAQPRLSWQIESDDPAARGVRQTAYHIIVTDDTGELWNSGKTESSQSAQISYAGKPLRSAQRISWKVRVWDDQASDWSAPATWTMGLLASEDWKAKWIGAPTFDGSKRLPVFRRSFALDKPIARALVFFCGLGQHELSVNGQVVGQDVMDPGWTNFAKTCLYASHDVTAMLKQGENVLTMMVGNGMYNVVGGRYVKFKGSFGRPRMILQMIVEFRDGTSTTILSDESWQAAPGPITFSCIYGGEDFDARLVGATPASPFGVAQQKGDAAVSPTKLAIIVDGPGGMLRSQSQPPIRVMRTYQAAKITEPKPGVKIYDFGQNMSGRAKIQITGDAGATVKLITGELLDEHGLVTQKHTGSPVSYSYTCCGGGEVESWNPRFTYTGFRYVQAEGAPLSEIEAQFTHSGARVVGNFECSDEMLNRIHALIDNAILSNMQSVLTDCPHREKLGWLEQSHLMGSAILSNYDVPTLYAKISRDMREAQHADGMVPTIAPQYTQFNQPHDVFNDSPEWGSAAVINPWLIYQRFGDRRILEDNFDSMKAYVEYLHSKDKDGIIEFGLGDWYDIGPGDPGFSKLTSLGLTATAIYFQDVVILRKTAELLGRNDDAARYASQATRILNAFNAKFFDAKTRRYDRNSQTASAMPLALGMVPQEQRAAVLENLVADIRAHNNHITAGDIGFHYFVRALGEGGRSDVILDMLRRTDPPSYGSQLARGATTLTEAWDANPKSSQNHFMLGHVEIWFYEYLAGIRIDMSKSAPEQIVIRPAVVGNLAWVKADYESVFGSISVHWRRQQGQLKLDLTIPPNASAIVRVPASDVSRARETGRPIDQRPEIRFLRAENGAAVCEVGSGTYQFESAVAE